MILVNHRVNTAKALQETPRECGVEIDIRPYNNRLVLNHEPFKDGENFETFLQNYNHKLLILNVKSEGIEKEVFDLVNKYKIQDYFFLDITFPFMIKYIKQGWNKMALRFSEYESIETCLALKNKVEWVFVDNFTKLPVENDSFNILKQYFKICIVSPELLNRGVEIPSTKELVKNYCVDAVLADDLDAWRQ